MEYPSERIKEIEVCLNKAYELATALQDRKILKGWKEEVLSEIVKETWESSLKISELL